MNGKYYDGSGNQFIIKDDELSYKPVKPEFSSSGTYDGGEAVTITLSEQQIQQLSVLFQAAIDDTKSHIEKRLMGSGQVIFQGKIIRLSMRSTSKSDLEKALRECIKI